MDKLFGFLGLFLLIGAVFLYGRFTGIEKGLQIAQKEKAPTPTLTTEPTPSPTLAPTPKQTPKPSAPKTGWGGPELWEAVNKRRVENGVNALGKRDELCTIASIRLNELLALGTLDGHAGFGNMAQKRPDLKWIFDKYNLGEFLIQGYTSPQESVSAWENTLGHRSLLAGGEWVWGCIYAQNTFGVAITAY